METTRSVFGVLAVNVDSLRRACLSDVASSAVKQLRISSLLLIVFLARLKCSRSEAISPTTSDQTPR